MRTLRPVWLGLFLASLCGCGQPTPRLNGGGSSFVFPIMSKWGGEYQKAKKIQIDYQPIGSAGGMQQMTDKTLDFGCTDAPMNEDQLKAAREKGGDAIHIPLVMGAVVPIYNLEGVKEPLRFTGPVLADIFLGKIKKWNDPALKELNPNVALPDMDISVVHRSEGSGSTNIWTDYLSKVSSEWKQKVGKGLSVSWPAGVGQKGSEGVAGQVKRSRGSISYVEMTYALHNSIQFGAVKNQEGAFVLGSLESVTAAAANSVADIADDLTFSLTDAPGKDSYPVGGTVWAVLYVQQPQDRGKLVVEFLRWATHEGQDYAKELHYARLPQELVRRVEKKLDQVKVGP